MRYVGSKARLAKRIHGIVMSLKGDRSTYYEPFLGGGNTFSVIAPSFPNSYGVDRHEDLALMWQAVAKGWLPPERVSEQEYKRLKTAEPSPLRGFAGFGCSFGGKWFAGYARGLSAHGDSRNYAAESQRNLAKQVAAIRAATAIRHGNYDLLTPEPGWVVYCDPPYEGTLGYKNSGDLDYPKFWDTVRDWSRSGALVLTSSYQAPPDFECIASFPHRMSVSLASDRVETIERLFMLTDK